MDAEKFRVCLVLMVLALAGLASCEQQTSPVLATPADLVNEYYNIFKTGNRNAASHLWTKFVLDRAATMSDATIKNVFKGFCPISGSPISGVDSAGRIYKVTVASVLGQNVTGIVRFCCSPCVCDLNENVRVDTLTVKTADGMKQYNMLVIGDPCAHEEKLDEAYVDPFNRGTFTLRQTAPELQCEQSAGKKKQLSGAVYSDNGFPVIGFLWTDASELSMWVPPDQLYRDWDPSHKVHGDDPTFGWHNICEDRKRNGYQSGMGLIFRLAATISPIPPQVEVVHTNHTNVSTFVEKVRSNLTLANNMGGSGPLPSPLSTPAASTAVARCSSQVPGLVSVLGIWACLSLCSMTSSDA